MKCIIYKIYNDDMAYIGSTKNFKDRMKGHKSVCNNEKSTKYNYFIYQYIRQKGGWNDFKKEIIYECDVKDKDEQRIVEQEWIKKNECKLNTNNSYTSKEERKEKIKQYNEKNKDMAKEQKKRYYEKNKEKIKEYHKQWEEKNKEKREEKRGQKINCPHCNLELRKDSLNKHIKRKH